MTAPIGKRNCLVWLQQRATVRHPVTREVLEGESDSSWGNVKQVWVHISTQGGTEKMEAQRVMANATHVVRLPYDPTAIPTTQMRFLYGTRKLNVVEAHDTDERHAEIVCLCKEAV
jgi:SPP1 family predicted phage head-tail adaptor